MSEIPMHHEQAATSTKNAMMMNLNPSDYLSARPIPNASEGDMWAGSQRLEVQTNLRDAIKQARDSGLPLVCVFEESYCGWCRKVDEELAKPEMARLNGQAIFVRLSPSTNPDAKVLADNLGVTGYPTISVIDINGSNIKERNRVTGFTTASDIANRVERPRGPVTLVA